MAAESGARLMGAEAYKVVYADPPWSYKATAPPSSSRRNNSQAAAYYYDTMSTPDICAMAPSVADDAVLFIWTTNPMLPDTFDVIDAWGFEYKTCITWHKLRCKGMGYWFRGHTEHLLLGVRGKVKSFRSLHHNIQALPVHKHSEKPLKFVEMIEEVTAGMDPKLEMFSRMRRPGWDLIGNQVREPDLLACSV
jgi:N6-adenosine-specific RNA methylase IME4